MKTFTAVFLWYHNKKLKRWLKSFFSLILCVSTCNALELRVLQPQIRQPTTKPLLTLDELHSIIYAYARRKKILTEKEVPSGLVNAVDDDPKIDGCTGLTPLACAAKLDAKADLFQKLFELGADPDFQTPDKIVKRKFCCCFERTILIERRPTARQQIREMFRQAPAQSPKARYLLKVLNNLDLQSPAVSGQTWRAIGLGPDRLRAELTKPKQHIKVID
jgi:hypothetical protein